MAIDSLGREVDHRTPCDEGKHEENCQDPDCDCNCHHWLFINLGRIEQFLEDTRF